MPLSSHQVNQMMAGQQAMFGNNASYAQQISPMGQASGMSPTYANPFGPMSSPGAAEFNQGMAGAPGMLNAAASYGAPMMMGAGMMMGGRMGAAFDPMTAGMRGFGRGVGWQGGAGISTNLGVLARGGVGGIARGIGMASMAAAPVMGMYAAGKYAIGQMAEGAQFQGQVSSSLQNNFRFTNEQSRTGYGFGQQEQRQIGSMLNQMGTRDMMTTPQELLGIMNQGTQMGMFRGVQDAKEFRQKFTQMKDSLTEIAKTFNTTLSEAVPFFQQARQQGFWTPQDITKHATQVRQTQANTGMSARQAQAVMGMGAQMARSIGGTGQQGSEMMARAQQISGAALFGGVVSSQQLGEAGYGTGAEGAQNLGTMLAGASTRFARSRTGRWALASMMDKEGTGLDAAKLEQLTSGSMSIGEISRNARRNVSGSRAYQFKMNEGELRGQLAEQGPEAALGIVKSLTGGRLYGEGGRDKLVTRRIIQRFMGGNARQADIVAKMAREMPRMMAIQAARTEGSLDSQERQREQQMEDTYEGFKRKMGHWWETKISSPLREAGADFSYRVGRTWQRFTDRLFGTTGRGVGLSAEAVKSMVRSAMTGDKSYITETMGVGMGQEGMLRGMAGPSGDIRLGSAAESQQMERMGFTSTSLQARRGTRWRPEDVREMGALRRATRGVAGEEEAAAIGYGGAGEMRRAMGGEGAQQLQAYLKSPEMLSLRGRMGAGDLQGEDRERYAQGVLGMVRAGRAGAAAQRMVEGVDDRRAMGRLMGAQGKARGGYTSMGDLGGGGLEMREGQSLRTAVEEHQRETVENLATLLRGGGSDSFFASKANIAKAVQAGGIEGVPITEQGLEELKKDSRGEQAMRLFAKAKYLKKKDPDAAAAALVKARGLMADIGNDKGGVSEEGRSAAIRMANGGDSQADAIADMAGKVGAGLSLADRVAFGQKISRRRIRFEERMGGSGMEALTRAAGGEGSALAEAFGTAMLRTGTGEGNVVTGKEYVDRMTALAEAAAADPKKAAAMLARMREEGLEDTDVGVTIRLAQTVSREAKKFGLKEDIEEGERVSGRTRRRARTGVRKRLGELGMGEMKLSKSDIDKIIKGEDVEDVTEKLEAQGYKEKDVGIFLEEMRGGMTVAEMVKSGTRRAGAAGIKTISEKVAKRAGLDSSELEGIINKKDSAQLQQMKIHTSQFGKMIDALGKISRDEKVTKKDKKTP